LNTLSCSTFFRRKIIDSGHLFDPAWKAVGDLLWIRGLLEAGRPMSCLPKPLAVFTFLGNNLGASSTAEEEVRRARRSRPGGPRLARRWLHGVRKLASGAYVRRRVSYDLFALPDPSARRCFHAANLGWTWPSVPTGGPPS
jgi:hypothetical protein